MKKLLVFLAVFSFSAALPAEEKMSSEKFLNHMRTPREETWGMMNGNVTFRKRGKSAISAPIRFSVLFTFARTVAKVCFKEKESCTITQSVKPPYLFHVGPQDRTSLPEYGITPGDLAMNFIFRKMIRELPEERVRTILCRVFEMEGRNDSESIRLYASADQIFPLKVEWFAKGAKKPFRTLEVSGFTRKEDLWMVTELSVSGPGWRSIVKFDPGTLKAGLIRNGIPRDLFSSADAKVPADEKH